MARIKLFYKILSVLFLAVLLLNWRSIAAVFEMALMMQGWWKLFLLGLGIVVVAFNLSAMVGLFLYKSWGFINAYLAIIISTTFFGFSYLPGISHGVILLAQNMGVPRTTLGYIIIALNLLMIIVIVYLHRTSKKLEILR